MISLDKQIVKSHENPSSFHGVLRVSQSEQRSPVPHLNREVVTQVFLWAPQARSPTNANRQLTTASPPGTHLYRLLRAPLFFHTRLALIRPSFHVCMCLLTTSSLIPPYPHAPLMTSRPTLSDYLSTLFTSTAPIFYRASSGLPLTPASLLPQGRGTLQTPICVPYRQSIVTPKAQSNPPNCWISRTLRKRRAHEEHPILLTGTRTTSPCGVILGILETSFTTRIP